MQTGGLSSAQIFEALSQLRAKWPKRGWSWDHRLTCVASSFSVEIASDARAAALVALPHEWNHRTVFQAPAPVMEVAETSGGVRTDQFLFSTAAGGRLIAYGLWWPWGDDTTISLRVGLAGYVGERDLVRLREVFNALE
jgi:hypothetical protein